MKESKHIRVILLTVLMCYAPYLFAEDTQISNYKHEVRIGWGDMMFETMAFHSSPIHSWPDPLTIAPDYTIDEKHDYRYTGHIFVEYQYSLLRWLSLGMQADMEGIYWKETTYDRFHNAVSRNKQIDNYNIALMPTIRFTYFHSEYVNLYSGIGIGLNIAFDNQNTVKTATAFHINLFSVQAGKDHWWGTIEYGALNAVNGANNIYMLSSRILSASIAYKL